MKVRTTIEVISNDGDVVTAVTECVDAKCGLIDMDEDDAAAFSIAHAAAGAFDHRPCGFDSIAILLFAVLESCENIHPNDKQLDSMHALIKAYELWLAIGHAGFSDSIKITVNRNMFVCNDEEDQKRISRCVSEMRELGAEVI